ncbi:DUF4913 domain-containing protein [Rothia mucilaginosa]|uniref:DUF4913 domain-containing protein n=1 Tax=Rothia mucilaginosa TaxID=43675 RepID=UPI0034C67F12
MQARSSALCFAPSLVIDHHYVSSHSVFEFRCTASLNRKIDSQNTFWCSEWWKHPEALCRLTLM